MDWIQLLVAGIVVSITTGIFVSVIMVMVDNTRTGIRQVYRLQERLRQIERFLDMPPDKDDD